jgi:hypothetical protein
MDPLTIGMIIVAVTVVVLIAVLAIVLIRRKRTQ